MQRKSLSLNHGVNVLAQLQERLQKNEKTLLVLKTEYEEQQQILSGLETQVKNVHAENESIRKEVSAVATSLVTLSDGE